ncbi:MULTISPECIES: hydroxyethylthiazole kinase [Pontibacillus]|uniref:Hydroxyethylthiazole kinase n=1 Tax=Pontibacillus chungwhensis TaxID=265426 RepID=A0ABY8V290_9BACI|nr:MULTISPECIES: hydroxyethylthiazole kinase [Pontibacillus]MCD5322276.1 hydroxyethylthiazole kinase [Pontibacillus sp. HN14]WIF99568.1 hydroxyethylthiazole kinase [Pontibacillus chungwhensis]
MSYLQKLRETTPLIHNLTNEVVMNFTANGLYAIGAAPVMSKALDEVSDMATITNGVLLNIGTLTSSDVEAMFLAGKAANKKGIPVVLDPVAAGATSYRLETCHKLLEELDITAIRGNAGEIAALIGDEQWASRGVDARGNGDVVSLAQKAAATFRTLIVLTGETDVIASEDETVVCRNGTPLLGSVTGTGCLFSSVLTAFLTLEGPAIEKATEAIRTYTVASEMAAEHPQVKGPGTLHPYFLDALYAITPEDVEKRLVR